MARVVLWYSCNSVGVSVLLVSVLGVSSCAFLLLGALLGVGGLMRAFHGAPASRHFSCPSYVVGKCGALDRHPPLVGVHALSGPVLSRMWSPDGCQACWKPGWCTSRNCFAIGTVWLFCPPQAALVLLEYWAPSTGDILVVSRRLALRMSIVQQGYSASALFKYAYVHACVSLFSLGAEAVYQQATLLGAQDVVCMPSCQDLLRPGF